MDRNDVSADPQSSKSVASLVVEVGRRFPRRSILVVSLMVLAGVFEGIGVLSLLPLLERLTAGDQEVDGVAGAITDGLEGIGIEPTIGALLVVVALGVSAKALVSLVTDREVGFAAMDLATEMRLELVRSLVRARWQHFADKPVGAFANAVSAEALRAAAFYTGSATLVANIVQVLMYSVLVALGVGPIVLLALAAGAVLFSVLHGFVGQTRRAGDDQTAVQKRLVSRLTEALTALKALKAMAREDQIEAILEAETKDLNRAQRKMVSSTVALPALQEPLIVALMAATVYVLVRHVGMEVERLLFMAFLFQRVITRLGSLQVSLQKLVGPLGGYRSLVNAIDAAKLDMERDTGDPPPHLRTAIRFDGVSFAYGDHAVLRDASFSIPAQRLTAMIGPSGGGKTTIVDLVVGLMRPDEGEIWIDDAPLGSISLRQWRSRIGYVPQDVLLLNDTVLANVTLHDPRYSEDDVREALAAAEALEFVEALPEGMHTMIGERGGRLSGGQRQRLTIARALVHKPELVILDEATTALDPVSEASICETLGRLTSTTTVLAISHQPAIARVADVVLEMAHNAGGSAPQPSRPASPKPH